MQHSWKKAVLSLALLAAGAPAMAQITRAEVTGGAVAGQAEGDIGEFKGIPFAASPVGALRWKAPQPVKQWVGVKRTVSFGAACMQEPHMANQMAPGVPMSENCLFIDVWTPARTPEDKLPVIAWIYGGGFSGGMTSAPLYDGASFARRGVVLVSISYRVGVFGFLATPALSRESGHGSGNYGLLDMIAGLKWVRANIGNFGGDPAKVTVLGHSAGSFAVSMLAGSPLAQGLFRGVIGESGANFMPPQQGASWGGGSIQTLATAERVEGAWLAGLGVSTLAQARALPADKLNAAQSARGAPRFWPPVDGYVVRDDQYRLWRDGRFNDVPTLLGDVSDEAAAFGARKMEPQAFEADVRAGYGRYADALLTAYPHATVAEATRSATQLRSDTTFDWGEYTWARLQSSHGKGRVWMYRFDRPSAADPNGSGHGQEVAYVFGNLGVGNRPAPTAEDRALSQQIQGYWVNFATTADPNGASLPQWPAFTTAKPQLMRFGVNPGPGPVANQDRLKLLDAYYDWRRAGGN